MATRVHPELGWVQAGEGAFPHLMVEAARRGWNAWKKAAFGEPAATASGEGV